MQSLTHWITLEPLLTNSNYLLRHTRKSIQRRHKLSLQTNNSIEETITTTITTAATPYITATNRNYIASYITKKDITYRNILRRSKKSLRPSLEISLRTTSKSK